jgi:hypothetical protein
MLEFELVRFGLSNLERLEVVGKLNLLVESLLERVVAIEELRFCRGI